MKKIQSTILLVFIGLALSLTSFAQEAKPKNCNISVGADFASMYLWRGFDLSNGPAIQPWGEFTYKGLTIGTWGSYGFSGDFNEIDLYAKYTYKEFSLMYYDLFFPGNEDYDQNFYNFNNKTTGHTSELGLSYNGSDKIPFSVFGGVILYGIPIDHKVYDSISPNDTTASNYSTYFEVNYLGKLKNYSFNVFVGFTPTESFFYGTEEFSVINVGLSAKKEVKVTDNFALPLKLTVATNPTSKQIFIAVVISI